MKVGFELGEPSIYNVLRNVSGEKSPDSGENFMLISQKYEGVNAQNNKLYCYLYIKTTSFKLKFVL